MSQMDIHQASTEAMQEKTDTNLKETKAKLESNREEVKATVRASKKKKNKGHDKFHPVRTGGDIRELDGECPGICRRTDPGSS